MQRDCRLLLLVHWLFAVMDGILILYVQGSSIWWWPCLRRMLFCYVVVVTVDCLCVARPCPASCFSGFACAVCLEWKALHATTWWIPKHPLRCSSHFLLSFLTFFLLSPVCRESPSLFFFFLHSFNAAYTCHVCLCQETMLFQSRYCVLKRAQSLAGVLDMKTDW